MLWDFAIDLTGEQVMEANLPARRDGSPGSDTYHEYHTTEGMDVLVDSKSEVVVTLKGAHGSGWHHRMACTCRFCLEHPPTPLTREQVEAAGKHALIPGFAFRYRPSEGFQRNSTVDVRTASPHWESIYGDNVPRGGWRHDVGCDCDGCRQLVSERE